MKCWWSRSTFSNCRLVQQCHCIPLCEAAPQDFWPDPQGDWIGYNVMAVAKRCTLLDLDARLFRSLALRNARKEWAGTPGMRMERKRENQKSSTCVCCRGWKAAGQGKEYQLASHGCNRRSTNERRSKSCNTGGGKALRRPWYVVIL